MGSWVKSIVGRKSSKHAKITSSKQDSGSEKQKQKGLTLWKNSGTDEKESSQNATEEEQGTVDSCDLPGIETPFDERNRAEQAAVCIQRAFRGFLARRSFRALKRLARLQETIKGQHVYKQSMASVHTIRDFVRIQVQIHSQRAVKRMQAPVGSQKPAANTAVACTKEADTEADWCHSVGTLEEIKSRIQQRQEAAIKRERALAYAFSKQRKRTPSLKPECLLDYDLDSSTWNWISLDHWIRSGGVKLSNTDKEKSNGSQSRNKEIQKKSSSVRNSNSNSHTSKAEA